MFNREMGWLTTACLMMVFTTAHADMAMYQVTFNGMWNPQDHPSGYPSGAHFSPLIGSTHNASVSFWEVGGMASSGIESMAETGATENLTTIINQSIDDGHAQSVIGRSGSSNATASVTFDFTISSSHPLVTLVTMIAPSPDWFVGVSGLNLLDTQNQWRNQVDVELYAHDAGTENGTGFSLDNESTSPQGVITQLHDGPGGVVDQIPFINQGSSEPIPWLATMTFTLIPEPTTGCLLAIASSLLLRTRLRR